MLDVVVLSTILYTTQQPIDDPLMGALRFHANMQIFEENYQEKILEQEERQTEAEAAARTLERTEVNTVYPSSLPPLLETIRSNESGGDYGAYNASGCEGYGCGGAYQLHALYAPSWASLAGYPGMGSNAAGWSPEIQDAVALWLYYSTNPDGSHWCNWTDYC